MFLPYLDLTLTRLPLYEKIIWFCKHCSSNYPKAIRVGPQFACTTPLLAIHINLLYFSIHCCPPFSGLKRIKQDYNHGHKNVIGPPTFEDKYLNTHNLCLPGTVTLGPSTHRQAKKMLLTHPPPLRTNIGTGLTCVCVALYIISSCKLFWNVQFKQ